MSDQKNTPTQAPLPLPGKPPGKGLPAPPGLLALPGPDPSAHRPAPLDPLQQYLREIRRFPPLDPEEELRLARQFRDQDDREAAFRLVSSHLRLVVKIAMDFQRRWMKNVLDLIQEGNVGLLRAVQKFDPDRGIKFSYYASFWIKAYIIKFIMDNWRMVKLGTTQAQRKLFFNLGKEKHRLESQGFAPDAASISESLYVSEDDVIQMGQRMANNDMSLDSALSDDTSLTPLDVIPALTPAVEDTLAAEQMSTLLLDGVESFRPKLNEKELDILDQRLLAEEPVTLREIGEKYGITRERVRQIEARLLEKLKHHLSSKIDDFSDEWISDE
ncbi:MAG: sigma-70 family RNA polymerase sigma factor [Deltaproteobacteria bacterium]|nr:sigma-70 family RNA polymerase sigma factor [Deltaproteobacteria bacterium]